MTCIQRKTSPQWGGFFNIKGVMTKINKYKLKESYVGSLDKFIERLDATDKKIVKDNGNSPDRTKN